MHDPRLDRLADLVVGHSLGLRRGEAVRFDVPVVAATLGLALQRAAYRCGAHPVVHAVLPELEELLLREGSAEQLAWLSPIAEAEVEAVDAVVTVWADVNTRSRSRLDPDRERMRKVAQGRLVQRMRELEAAGELRWCGVLHPTAGHAQDAELSLAEYADLLLGACHVDEPDPAAWWRAFAERLSRRARMLEGVRELRIVAEGTDVTLSVAGRPWVVGDGSQNMPDGEIFTCPVETSASGEVAFSFAGVHDGHLLDGVRLRLEGGRVVAAEARGGKAYLDALLALDDGASRIGEVAFGMNPEITRATGHIGLDEKIGGTMHLALGRGFAEAGGSNVSALHLDLVVDLRAGGEVHADGELVYRDGRFLDEPGEGA